MSAQEGCAERRVREAFASVHAPEDVKARTLASIEAARAAENEACGGDAPAARVPVEAYAPAHPRPSRSRAVRLLLAACLVVAVAGVGLLGVAVVTPTAYVSIDVNPSLELAVNRFDTVVGARGLNEDGEEVVSSTDVTWMGYEDAVGALVESMESEGYLTKESAVSVTVTCDDEVQYDTIEDASHRCLGEAASEVSCSHAGGGGHHHANRGHR